MTKLTLGNLLAGLCVAASMPPWGWWPLAFIGIAAYGSYQIRGEINKQSLTHKQRALASFIFGMGWFFPSLAWMWFMTAPGYVVAVFFFAGLFALASWWSSTYMATTARSHATGLALSLTLVETLRLSFPFGGVPLSTLAISQARSPMVLLAPLGGVILITFVVFRISISPGRLRTLTAFAVLLLVAIVWSPTSSTGESLRIALVQGGGEQGTRAVNTNPRIVFERHLEATRTIAAGTVDLVIWPENVIDVYNFEQSREKQEVAQQAQRLGVPISVGITEDVEQGDVDGFLNAQVVVQANGDITDRVDKVRRVPFGEYMPLRGFLSALGAPTNLVPRNAIEGTGPAVLNVGEHKAAVVISWEVFFGGRANEGVVHGGEFIMNPTNGSSYTWTILQTQQVASSLVRAREQGRWVAQVSPTGFSAFITHTGRVIDRTKVSEQRVIATEVPMRTGRTLYSRLGNAPFVIALLLAWGVASAPSIRRQRSKPATDQ
jgi:apolipoprotein N-acyltransferase